MTKTTIKLMGAVATAALLTAPATAWEGQSTIVIEQVQLHGTLADLDVHVPDTASGATAASTAVGNSGSGLIKAGHIDYDAIQTGHGDVTATNSVTGGAVSGTTHAATTAYGNASTAGTWMGDSFYHAEQTMNGDTTADTVINLGATEIVVSATTAAANVSVSAAEFGKNSAYQTQASNGNVSASTDADLCCVNTGGAFLTTASGNVASSTGYSATSINGAVQTTTSGTSISAATDVYSRDGNDVSAASTASGNSYVLDNKFGYASLGRQGSELYQENAANTDAQSYVTLDHWSGTASSTAYGVGNSALVSNSVSDTALHSIQNNYGTVSSTASFSGQSYVGGAGAANATSIGNAASAVLCNMCGSEGMVGGNVHQNNAGATIATTRMNTGVAGPVIGSATAIGNSASFQSTGD